jgi:hypothetical protein
MAYDLYQPKEDKKDFVEKLKAKGDAKNKFTVEGFTKRLLKNILVKLIKKLAGFFESKGLNFTAISWSAGMGILSYIIGGAALPWAAASSAISIPWICGGFLASKLLEKIGKTISKTEVMKDLKYLKEMIQENTEELMMSYAEVTQMIEKCFLSESEKEFEFFKGSLAKKLDLMLEETKSEILGNNKQMNQSRLDLSMLTTKEEDDWVVCDIEEDTQDKSEDIQLDRTVSKHV